VLIQSVEISVSSVHLGLTHYVFIIDLLTIEIKTIETTMRIKIPAIAIIIAAPPSAIPIIARI